MERPYNDALIEALGERYRLGSKTDDGYELAYRFGKAEFRPSRVSVIGEGEARRIGLRIDVRVPDGHELAEGDTLVDALESKSLSPRGFERQSDDVQAMTSEAGNPAGYVRTLVYHAKAGEPKETSDRIRAIVETLDIPIVVGIHEPRDVVAKRPLPPPKKKGASMPHDAMEVWTYTLAGGVLRSLDVIIDPNVRTLEVYERKLFNKQKVGDTVKLAHVAKFGIRETDGEVELLAEKREGGEVSLAKSVRDPSFVATAQRMADKVFISLERM